MNEPNYGTDRHTDSGMGAALRIEKPVYGGDGLARSPEGEVVFVPFALPGEWVQTPQSALKARPGEDEATALPRVLESSSERVQPRCGHFGRCGGCQYQMASYPAQLLMKETILRETLERAGVRDLPALQRWASPEDYGYRNRIRLRVRTVGDELKLGYSARGGHDFLPIAMCPIAAPSLWRAVEEVLTLAKAQKELRRALAAASEAEFFCNGGEDSLQITLLCAGKTAVEARAFGKAMEALRAVCPELKSAAAMRFDPRSGRSLELLASWGATGLAYPVAGETYWVSRGGFFQVNRSLLRQLTELVCRDRRPQSKHEAAWDLFAGVGLFSRVLAGRFQAVTAVEANPAACADLRRALAKLGRQHRAVEATTVEFLRRAVVERERPELIVLDPPRAGAGEEVCRLLARLAPDRIVYLSCDPTTLARDLAILTGSGYTLSELHLIDLFPQTYHLETLIVLCRSVGD